MSGRCTGCAAVAAWAGAALAILLLLSPGLATAQPASDEAQPDEAQAEPCPGGANYTAADCPNGSCYAGEPNGCGSRSVRVIAAEIVPEKWPAGVDFTDACNAHDTCYFTAGSDKAACDQAFLDALLAECESSLKCVDLPLVGRQCQGGGESNPLYDACAGLAQVYYEAVDQLGAESFAQDQADQEAHVQQCQGPK